MGRGKASRPVGANTSRLRSSAARTVPSASGLLEAVLELKEEQPQFGIKRVWKVLHDDRGWEVSQQRIQNCLRAANLISHPPAGPRPQLPGPAALAVFMGTHHRLGEGSPILQLEGALLEHILDIYAE
eukprot:1802496-Rhodomonas_salina.2